MNRRSFVALGAAVPATKSALGQPASPAFPDLLRTPDRITAFDETGPRELSRSGSRWTAADIEITAGPHRDGRRSSLPIAISASKTGLTQVRLRWRSAVPETWRFLGDHWERSYGDLEWRGMAGDRVMPWYFAASNGRATHAYGVKTGASAIASWRVDAGGITLWLDVRNGGSSVLLRDRLLEAATVVGHITSNESPMAATRQLCRAMCDHPRLPPEPVYGGNNWYYTYGRNLSAEAFLRDADLMADLAPGGRNRPYMVLDMGYGEAGEGAGPVRKTNAGFPDMPALVANVKKRGVRPGIWVRPLLTVETLPDFLRLPGKQAGGGIQPPFAILDPSLPDALQHVTESIQIAKDWGYDLIKHDYSTYDITGRWGFQMAAEMAPGGWRFHDRSRTTAEIVRTLYQTIRDAAGDMQVIGCNTIGHLGAGLFEMQRIGDDTSGREWARTRKMGINTLAFRLPQHNTFFAADADCVPVTKEIPWNLTTQWLDLVSRSTTPLFISIDPADAGPKERTALRAAFERASRGGPEILPDDWMNTTVPIAWSQNGKPVRYRWYEDD